MIQRHVAAALLRRTAARGAMPQYPIPALDNVYRRFSSTEQDTGRRRTRRRRQVRSPEDENSKSGGTPKPSPQPFLSGTYVIPNELSQEEKATASKPPTKENVPNFRDHVRDLASVLVEAVEDMVELNPGFHTTLGANKMDVTIELGPGLGQVKVVSQPSRQTIKVTLPVSGTHEYLYEPSGGTWLSTADSHDLKGIITRDMLRLCNGCPKL